MHDTEKKLVVCVIVQRGDDQFFRVKKYMYRRMTGME